MKGYCSVETRSGWAESFSQFLRDVTILGFDEETMKAYAQIRGTLRAQGTLIGEGDLLIAATAVRNSLPLVSRNTREFGRVSGLDLYQDDSL